MAAVLRELYPQEYHRQLLLQGIRSDGRRFDEFRPAVVQTQVISTSIGSSMVRHGDSVIIASIKSELYRPPIDKSDKGKVEVQILQSTKLDRSSSGDEWSFLPYTDASYCCDQLQSLLDNGVIVDLKSLCIEKGKLCWILKCDVVIIDGVASLDGCLVALSTALQSATLPNVVLKPAPMDMERLNISEVEEEPNRNEEEEAENLFTRERIKIDQRDRRILQLESSKPVASLFAFIPSLLIGDRASVEDVESGYLIFADPSIEEIKALSSVCEIGTASIVVGEDAVCGLHLSGVGSFMDNKLLDRPLKLARGRRKLINRLISEACKANS